MNLSPLHIHMVSLVFRAQNNVCFVLQLKASLEEHFSSCGEITSISVPKFWDSGVLKGYVSFSAVKGVIVC